MSSSYFLAVIQILTLHNYRDTNVRTHEDVPAEIDDSIRPFLAEEEGALRVEDDAAPFVDPEVLVDERAVLLRQEAVRETDEAVRGRHGSGSRQVSRGWLGWLGRKTGTGVARRWVL